MKKLLSLILFIAFLTGADAQKKDPMTLYQTANVAYQKMDYAKAVDNYEQLIKDGYISPEVFFNLGNSYFKTGNVPKAILSYERGKKLSPDDEDINFNLKIASLKVVDRIDAVPEVFYKRWLHSIAISLPGNNWSMIFILMIWLTFISAGVYVISRTSMLKKTGFALILVFGVFSVISYLLSARSYSIHHAEEQAIIMSSSVYVKSSPDEKGNDLFILHEGTKVEVIEPFEDWKKIRIANGTVGWLKRNDIEKI